MINIKEHFEKLEIDVNEPAYSITYFDVFYNILSNLKHEKQYCSLEKLKRLNKVDVINLVDYYIDKNEGLGPVIATQFIIGCINLLFDGKYNCEISTIKKDCFTYKDTIYHLKTPIDIIQIIEDDYFILKYDEYDINIFEYNETDALFALDEHFDYLYDVYVKRNHRLTSGAKKVRDAIKNNILEVNKIG